MNVLEFKDLVRKTRRTVLRAASVGFSQPLNMDFRSIAVIAPHPDDEIFGCAGLIGSAIAGGCEVSVLFLSSGSGSHRGCCDVAESEVAGQRHQLAIKAAERMGIQTERLAFLDGDDGSLPGVDNKRFADLENTLRGKLNTLKPEAVFCPGLFEGWPDHMVAAELTRAAMAGLGYHPRLYYYCVWFWYTLPLRRAWRVDWRKARVLDIREQLLLKKQAMRIYLEALAPCGHPWVGRLPKEFLRAFEWDRELFFEAAS